MKILVDKSLESGYYTKVWNGTDEWENQVSSGIYLCRLNLYQSDRIISKENKMILLK